MMARVAAVLVLVPMLLLLWVTFDMNGHTATWFSFVGHPMLGVGLLLGAVALTRRLRREAAAQSTDRG